MPQGTRKTLERTSRTRQPLKVVDRDAAAAVLPLKDRIRQIQEALVQRGDNMTYGKDIGGVTIRPTQAVPVGNPTTHER